MRPWKTFRTAGTALLALILVAVVWTRSEREEAVSRAGERMVPAGPAAVESGTVPFAEAVERLTVAAESEGKPYERERFRLYQDVDGDGCDARREVLITQAVTPPSVRQPGCELSGGEWVSPYDGKRSTDPGELQIDHVVALKEAWESGAWEWESARLVEYGSFLEDPGHLVAVSGESNSAKGHADPAEWLPSNEAYVCRYLADWVGVKLRWGLSADEREMRVLRSFAEAGSGECGREPVRGG
ncbi:HNH endonuclease family protein [Streptomyces cellulosae]|uniref:HNH endonuclease family protein n=1 Tax=Streptomyces cellulosae TaxID=1968 RepID=A0ABW6JGA3_STRCE